MHTYICVYYIWLMYTHPHAHIYIYIYIYALTNIHTLLWIYISWYIYIHTLLPIVVDFVNIQIFILIQDTNKHEKMKKNQTSFILDNPILITANHIFFIWLPSFFMHKSNLHRYFSYECKFSLMYIPYIRVYQKHFSFL